MRKRQAKVDLASQKARAALRENLTQRIASTVTLIIEIGETEALVKTLARLRKDDEANDGFAYADAVKIVNQANGFEKTGEGEFRLR